MFPRPLSFPYCNVAAAGNHRQRLNKTVLFTPSNKNVKDIRTCTFFTPKSERLPAHTHRRINTTFAPETTVGPEKFLRPRQTLHESFIKTKYSDTLKTTFAPCRNLRHVSDRARRVLAANAAVFDSSPTTQEEKLGRSFADVQAELTREAKESIGFCPSTRMRTPISFRGVYSVKPPTESELYTRAMLWRKRRNPRAAAMETEMMERDKMLFAKKHAQNLLKYRLMRSIEMSRAGHAGKSK